MSQFALSTASPSPHLAPPLATSSPLTVTSPGGGPKCCDTGRVLYTDPVSGHAVCSCQYGAAPSSHLLAYQSLASRLPLMYGCDSAYLQALQQGQPPPPPGKEAAVSALGAPPLGAPPGWPYSLYYPYGEAGLSPYGLPPGYGFGLDGSRRKNATAKLTSTLKAWLNEHKKNPYPTKGEKIMLAIITKMTLTQVSTWFANARRRLKKENKMTWEPRNRTDEDDGDSDAEVGKSDDDAKPREKIRSVNSTNSHVPYISGSPAEERPPEDAAPSPADSTQSPVKPRIWSLADLAMSGSSPTSRMSSLASPFLSYPLAGGLSGGGKLLLPFARPHHVALPYGRPEAASRPSPTREATPSPPASAGSPAMASGDQA